MIIDYKDGEINKKPYDSKALNQFLKSMGFNAKKTRSKGGLIIETDKDLTAEQIDLLRIELNKYDLRKTKKTEVDNLGKD